MFEGMDDFEFKPVSIDSEAGVVNPDGTLNLAQENDLVKNGPKYEDNPWGFGPWRDVSRYMIMEDVNIPEDPYYLVRYRSFHNHEVDLNLMAHINLVSEKDIWRKGAWRTMP